MVEIVTTLDRLIRKDELDSLGKKLDESLMRKAEHLRIGV